MDAIVALLISRATPGKFAKCTADTCPIEKSVYGYYPNKPVNIILIALFGISMILHFWQGFKSRSWTFLLALGIGSFGEATGDIASQNHRLEAD